MAMNGTITLVSNRDKGRMTKPQIPADMNLDSLIAAELGLVDPANFAITVDGETVKDRKSFKLKSGQFVIITPTNVKGN